MSRKDRDEDPLDAVLRPPNDESPEQAAVREAREAEARRVSASIDADIRAERLARRKKRIVRLLLLGQSESGKSTTLRQFQRLYTPTAFRAERILWRAVIQLNIVRSIRTILDALDPATPASASIRRRRPSAGPASASMLALASPAPPHALPTADITEVDRYASYAYPATGYDSPGVDSDGDVDSDPGSGAEGPAPSHSGGTFRFAPPPVPVPAYSGAVEALRQRLLPLRHVEALLIARLVPAADLDSAPTRLDRGAGVTGGVPLPLPSHSQTDFAGGGEVFVRPGMRWKVLSPREKEKERARSRSRDRGKDEAQEALHTACGAMRALWGDAAVRAVLRKRKIRLEEGPGFFLNDLERVTAPNYLPTDDDVLRARLKTVGVSEYTFEMEVATGRETGTEWRIVDVGGSRSQRATWIPFFDDVDAIIFLAPISGFDQVLSEDRTVNRLEDSVLLWKAVCGNKLLASVDLVLFLNKCDILARKIAAGVKLARYVRSYADRENTFEAVSSYLRTKFMAIHRECSPNPRKFYAFCTSVTDSATTGGIIASVRDMVVRQHLKQSKLL